MPTTPPVPAEPSRPVDVRALFLGPQAENREFFEQAVSSLIDEHVHWRRDFHPTDAPVFGPAQMRDPSFTAVQDRTRELLETLTGRLKSTSTPWFSTRYLGHMNSDTLMVANLAEIATILYNPNNVAYESSVATSQMETEVGADFARLMGYDPARSWGHITTDGSVSNYEALWLARNLKSFPRAVSAVLPELVERLDEWALLNMAPEAVLCLLDKAKSDKVAFAKVLAASSRGAGAGHGGLGKVLVPASRHYSWDKATDLLGIGVNNLVPVPVDSRYRMDLGALRSVIDELVAARIPVLALVGVVGTTEEGAIDDIAGMRDIIIEARERGVNFYFHIDAAYGGYGRALFLDDEHNFMPEDELRARLHGAGLASQGTWPSHEVWPAYEAMSSADSVTIDPHKMGYVPYAAGGITLRDRRILGLISYSAAYVFEDPDNLELSLGSVILEGSKSGMVAAGVWASHRLIPLTHDGYGQLIGRSWTGAQTFAQLLQTQAEIDVAGRRVLCQLLMDDPDFNIVCMAFNVEGNEDLTRMNALNTEVYHRFSYEYGPLYQDDWITSHTDLDRAVYGQIPVDLVKRLGIAEAEWDRVGRVVVLRSCVMHPWIADGAPYPERWQSYLSIITDQLERILTTEGADYQGPAPVGLDPHP